VEHSASGNRRVADDGIDVRRLVASALVAVSVAACGNTNETSPSAPSSTNVVTVPREVVDSETAALCESFLPDVVGGTIALVDFTFMQSVDDEKIGQSPFQASKVKIARVRTSSLKDPLGEGETSVVTLTGGGAPNQIVGMREAAQGAQTVGLLIPSQMDDVRMPRLVAVIADDRFESGDVCAEVYTKRLNGAAAILGIGLVSTVERVNDYYNEPNESNLEVGWSLGEFSGGVPQAPSAEPGTEPSPEEMWKITPARDRDLDWLVMPDEVKQQVDVYGIIFTLPKGFPIDDVFVRCQLGVGYATVTNFEGERVAAATLCTNLPTEVEFAGQIAIVQPTVWDRELGNRISLAIDAAGLVSVKVEKLAPRELERVSGLTRVQLEARRESVKAGEFTSP
jgi:hypothetical protein